MAMIRRLQPGDTDEHARMRAALWPDEDASELREEIAKMLDDPDQVIFVAERDGAGLCGMVEAGIRAFADAVDEQPCAYVEGWWVDADVRRTGVGRALIAAVEAWARQRGFLELGSDALVENTISHAAHRALGFEQRETIVTFRKFL
jgi:aminoglycoside 6'-N-acetyltransferase I